MNKAGYGQINITPALGVELCGYGYYLGRKAESVHDELYARCLSLEIDGSSYMLYCCDLIGLLVSHIEAVRDFFAYKYGMSKANIMFISTHTHCGPTTFSGVGCGEPDADYLDSLSSKLISAGELAITNMKDIAALKSMARRIEAIGFNRALENGPVDDFVRGFIIKRTGGRDIAVASYACHPVTLGRSSAVTADYPGEVVRALESAGMYGIFLNGPCGDIDPVSNKKGWGSGGWDTIKEYGTRIAEAFIEGIQRNARECEISLSSDVYSSSIPLREMSAEEIASISEEADKEGAVNGVPGRIIETWRRVMEKRLRGDSPYIERADIQILRLGHVLIVALPHEAFTEIGQIIRDGFPDMNVLVPGNANATFGYLPSRAKIEQGGYEGLVSSYLYLRLPYAPGAGELLAEGLNSFLDTRSN